MAKPTIVRQINETQALRTLFANGPLTRAELARRLGVTKSTVTKVVASLVANGLVREGGDEEGKGRVGRPGTYVELDPAGGFFLGAEIGVDRLNVVVMDLATRIVGRRAVQADCAELGVDAVLDRLAGLVEDLQRDLATGHRLKGLCVSVPGFLTRDSVILSAPILGWRDLPILPKLAERFPWPIAVDNDANVSAYAEWYLTPALRNQEVLMILLETGIGGGLIASGRVVRGAHGLAGEIGHMQVGERAGSYRHQPLSWEEVVGRRALVTAYGERLGRPAGLEELCVALAAGEPAAVEVAGVWSRWLARGIAMLTYAHDPHQVILGGALAQVFAAVHDQVEAELRQALLADFPAPALAASRFGADGCAVGAAAIMHAGSFAETGISPLS